MKKMIIISCIALTASLTSSYVSAEMYKWKDSNGEIHYTQTPPPAGTDSTNIEDDIKLSTGKLGNVAPTKTSDKTTQDSSTDDAAAEKKSEEQHRDFCTQQNDALKKLSTNSLVKWKDDQGERFLTAAEKSAKIKELQKNLGEMCRPEMFSDSVEKHTTDTDSTATDDGIKTGNSSNNDSEAASDNNTDNSSASTASSPAAKLPSTN